MPRIVRILNRFVIGGPVLNITYLSKLLSDEFESLMIVGENEEGEKEATHLKNQYDLNIIKIKEMGRSVNPYNDYIAYKKIKDIILSYKPDIVHTHAAKSGLLGRLAAAHCNVPVILHTFHGHVFHSYFNKLQTDIIIRTERWLAKKSTGIIAISGQQKHELANLYKICHAEKIKILPLGLDTNKFHQDATVMRNGFRNKYMLADEEIAVGIIGRIVPIKNHSYFINIAVQALKQSSKKLRFFIIGDGSEAIKISLQTEIKNLGLDYCYFPDNPVKATFTFTSWIIDIEKAYAGLDIIMITSLNEGTPVSLMEAQVSGKPVLSTLVGGVPDVVINNETGYCIEKNNFNEYVQKLLLLAEDEELRNKMGAKGKEFIENNFSVQQLISKTREYFRECLANHHQHKGNQS